MNYGSLVRDAWRITWQHPFLWVLGVLAGGTAGTSFFSRRGGGEPPLALPDELWTPRAADGMEAVTRWAGDHVALVVGAVSLLVLAGLALMVLSMIAQGGLTGATAALGSGRTTTLRQAWRAGLHLFWRYAGLSLLLVAAVMVIGALAAGFVALVVGLTRVVERDALVVIPATLIGLLVSVLGIVASIVVPFAQRAVAVLDVGPLAALRDGWSVFRAHPGASLIVWLLNMALTIAIGLAVTAVLVVTVLALGLPAAALWAVFDLSAPTFTYLAVAGVVACGLLLTVIGIANTFLWSYWTLAYLRLRSGSAAPPRMMAHG